jgi:PAS domain S-box-containing protein
MNSLGALLAAAALLILAATILLSYRDWREFREATALTRHTEQVLDSTETLLSNLKDAETGQRGYLLTGEKRYLEPYNAALAVIPDTLGNLMALTGARGRQAARARLLEPLVSEKLAELRLHVEIRDTQGIAAAIDRIRTDRGKIAMDRIREICAQIIHDEYGALAEQSRVSELHGQRTRLVTTLGSAILFVMLLGAGLTIASATARREHLIGEVMASQKRTAEVRDLMQTTLSSIGDAVVATDARGKITFINPVAQALTEYSEREAFGKPVGEVFRIVNESTRATVESPAAKVLREGTVVGLANHTVLISRSGVEIPIDDSGAPIRRPDGSMAGVVLVFRDITARKKAQEAALRLAAIVESSDDAIIAQELGGKVASWNAGAERMFGYTAAEMIGQDLSLVIGEESQGHERELLERIIAGETAIHFESVRRRKDGALIRVAAVIGPLFDEAGKMIGVSRIGRDITEYHRTLAALRESEERLRLSAEAAQIGVWSYDQNPARVALSPQLESLLGMAPGSFSGSNIQGAGLFHPEDRQRALEVFSRALEGKTEFEVEFRFIRADGETRWMLARGGPVCDAAGAVTGLAGVAIDITSRKRLEDKMRHSQKLESLGVLAGGIAHDFNNLLVGILGNASLLLEESPPNSPLRGVIDNLVQASESAAHLTGQMLAYSGKGRFTIERLNLDAQVQQILAVIKASIPKGVRIELNFQPDLPPVEADSGQIQQLVMNLAINGAEAIGSGGGTVTISTYLWKIDKDSVIDNQAGESVPPGSYLVLEVRDTGIGMDAATQGKIFDPFFTTKFTGRGLGLAAVQGIVRGHKGALTVSSQLGEGSTIRVFLPAASGQEKADRDSVPPIADFRGEGTILVVDDEQLVQRTIQASLERYGYRVLVAGSGEAAIRLLRETPDRIALVLLDMTMPVMSGEDALRGLLAIRPDIPVIATSGYNEIEALRRFGHGLSGFIQKPYTGRKLAEKIRSVLEKSSLGAGA